MITLAFLRRQCLKMCLLLAFVMHCKQHSWVPWQHLHGFHRQQHPGGL